MNRLPSALAVALLAAALPASATADHEAPPERWDAPPNDPSGPTTTDLLLDPNPPSNGCRPNCFDNASM